LEGRGEADRESYLNMLAEEVKKGMRSNHLGPVVTDGIKVSTDHLPSSTKLTGHHATLRLSLYSAGILRPH